MRIKPKETYEEWAKRVQMYEQGHAMQRIATGEDTDLVLTDMARRITEKMLHPVLKSLQDTSIDMEKFEKDKQAYYAIMKKIGPVADHVTDDLQTQLSNLGDTKN
jgi:glutamyl-tRNA reductase